jgi:predicted extracellular nuclease
MKIRQFSIFTAPSIFVSLATGLFVQTAGAELFISEYIEGSSFNKAIEIYNRGSGPVDLSAYELQRYSNGNPLASSTQALSGNLAAGDVYIVANGSANAGILAVTDLVSSVINFNGDGSVPYYRRRARVHLPH